MLLFPSRVRFEMNVTFHTLTSLATASLLASRQNRNDCRRLFAPVDIPLLVTGFLSGILMHGLLDYVPHWYVPGRQRLRGLRDDVSSP